jgi:hypothetical protein
MAGGNLDGTHRGDVRGQATLSEQERHRPIGAAVPCTAQSYWVANPYFPNASTGASPSDSPLQSYLATSNGSHSSASTPAAFPSYFGSVSNDAWFDSRPRMMPERFPWAEMPMLLRPSEDRIKAKMAAALSRQHNMLSSGCNCQT